MRLIDYFKENKGYIHTQNIRSKRNLFIELHNMVQAGEVVQLKRGLYKHPKYSILDHWQEVSVIYPKAVLYLFSAFAYYNLSTYMPTQAHLAINRKSKLTVTAYLPVKLHYIHEQHFHKHIINIEGVNIYNMERTICDGIKQQKQIGTDIMTEVIKSYIKKDNSNLDRLSKTAKEINMESKVNQIINIMVNL